LVLGHPGSGIVVTADGTVFFQDSVARTIWRVGRDGKLTPFHDKLGGHWMTVDHRGVFAHSKLEVVERLPIKGKVALLVADGGAPVAILGKDLVYGLSGVGGKVTVGLTRFLPGGQKIDFVPSLGASIEHLGVTGLATGPGGSVFAACLNQVIKIKKDGSFKRIAEVNNLPGCQSELPTVFLRGLDVDSREDVYVAAAGCGSVLKISPNGTVEVVLTAVRPWLPTGVAVRNGVVYVLEYTNANGAAKDGWLPRVRKIERTGEVTAVATISEQQQNAQPNRMQIP
jgi:hypothetical protein